MIILKTSLKIRFNKSKIWALIDGADEQPIAGLIKASPMINGVAKIENFIFLKYLKKFELRGECLYIVKGLCVVGKCSWRNV